jgi:class 3 adenylate cyclase/HAMP domain-containing protein
MKEQIVKINHDEVSELEQAQILKTNDKGDMYLVIYNGKEEEILKVDRAGKVIKRIEIGLPDTSYKTNIKDIYIDRDDDVYVFYEEYSALNKYMVVKKFDSSLYNESLILRKKNNESLKFTSFSEDNSYLYGGWFGAHHVVLFKASLDQSQEITLTYDYQIQSPTALKDVLALPNGNIMFTDFQGRLYVGAKNGNTRKIYPQDGEEAIVGGLSFAGEESAYFYDLYKHKFFKVLNNGSKQLLIDSGKNLNKNITLADTKMIFSSPEGRLTALADEGDQYKLINGGFSFVSVIDELEGKKDNDKALFIIVEICIFVLLITLLLWDFYCKIMNMRMSIILKQCLGLLTAVLVIFVFMTSSVSKWLLEEILYNEYKSHLLSASRIIQNEIKENDLRVLSVPSNTDQKVYEKMKALIKEPVTYKENKYTKEIYYNLYNIEENNGSFIFSSNNQVVGFPIEKTTYSRLKKVDILKAIDSSKPIFDKDLRDDGEWMYMMMPIFNNGKKMAFEIGLSMKDFNERYNTLKLTFTFAIIIIAGIMLLIIMITLITSLLSIRKLSRGVDQIAAGHFDVRVIVRSGDEIEQLSKRFNDMAGYIQNYIKMLGKLNESYYRFIPERLIKMLGVNSIQEVQKSDHVKEEMAVINFNIRSFFELTKGMSSEDVFEFINGIYERFSLIVESFNGIIDRFMDTRFTAIFPDSPENAMNAALRIQEKLAAWNIERERDGLKKVNIGVSVHFGTVMFGVIGDGTRLASAAVSQAIHTSMRLENYADEIDVSVIATEEIARNLPVSLFKKRSIGKFKDGNMTLTLYDFYEGDTYVIRNKKEKYKELLHMGIEQYEMGDYHKAKSSFIEILRSFPEDGVARKYLDLSEGKYKKDDQDKVTLVHEYEYVE